MCPSPSCSISSAGFSLAAVNPDACTGSDALAPAGCVPGVLSAVRDVRQQARDGMTSGPGHVGRVSRQRCGQTGMWQWSRCDRLSESHQAVLTLCHPTWLQKLWIQILAPRLLVFHPRCFTPTSIVGLLNSADFFIWEMHRWGGWLGNSVAQYWIF